jgi:hypothetical protein
MNLTNFKMNKTDAPQGVQAMIDFGLYQLSIIQNEMSYGGKDGLYEIGVWSENDMVELPGITADGDTVKGFLTTTDVDAILKKLYLITGNEGKQL